MAIKNTITIGLAQINNSFSGQNYLPLSAGLLQSYAQGRSKNPQRFRFLTPLFKRLPAIEAARRLNEADVAGFSIYVWNVNLTLDIARRMKKVKPETLIVFGGPQVPDRAEDFLKEHPFIDIAIHNEGEQTFLDILESVPGNDWGAIQGISFIDGGGKCVKTPPREMIRDLSEIPSPYLEGVFDPLIAANPGETWIGMWETNRGCPFQCTFCDWGALASKVRQYDMDRIRREIGWFAANRIEFIFCCDANFGILKRDLDIIDQVTQSKNKTGYPLSLSLQNTKNATERAYQTQKALSDAGLNKGVTLSMQSLNAETLKLVKRDNISLESYEELQRRFTRDRVETYSDLILGLPGETYDSFADGVDRLIRNGQHNRIQFNNLSILVNSEMAGPDYRNEHGLITVNSEIINIHGHREKGNGTVAETQEIVIATKTMPEADWRRVRAFSWMAALVHFDKLLQMPMIAAHELAGAGYRELVEAFLEADGADYPLIHGITDFFNDFSRALQLGGPEYVYSEEWLGIYWPADEYIFIKLLADGDLDAFFDEAMDLILAATGGGTGENAASAIREAAKINRVLIKRPGSHDDTTVKTDRDVLAFCRGVIRGEKPVLGKRQASTRILRAAERWDDFNDWCREVVWYGNKKGAYLYGAEPDQTPVAGHY